MLNISLRNVRLPISTRKIKSKKSEFSTIRADGTCWVQNGACCNARNPLVPLLPARCHCCCRDHTFAAVAGTGRPSGAESCGSDGAGAWGPATTRFGAGKCAPSTRGPRRIPNTGAGMPAGRCRRPVPVPGGHRVPRPVPR